MSESHASEYSNAVFNAISGENTSWCIAHVRSEIDSLVSEFFKDVLDFIVNFSVHSQIRSKEVLPWHDLILWHKWVHSLIFMKFFQALDNSVNFITLGVDFMGPLFLGGCGVKFVLSSVFIHNSLLFWRKMTLVLLCEWVIEVLLFQDIDDVVSWNDSDQSSFLVNNWETVMVVFFILENFLDVFNGLNLSEDINISFHHVVSFQVFAAFSNTVVGENWHLFSSNESLISTSSELISNCVGTESTPEHW